MSRVRAVSFVVIVLFTVAAVIEYRSYIVSLAGFDGVWIALVVVLSLLACMHRSPAPRGFTRTTAQLLGTQAPGRSTSHAPSRARLR